jgi:PAS domain-containing protein
VLDATAPLKAMVPNLLGQSITHVFNLDTPGLPTLPTVPSSVFGRYTNAAGALVPAILQFLSDRAFADGSTLVLVLDGAPFRRAEARRFDATPYPVLRLRPDGRVGFANCAATGAFNTPCPTDLVGALFSSLFSPAATPAIHAALSTALEGRVSEPVDAAARSDNHGHRSLFRLMMIPDLAPDDRSLGALAIVRCIAIERARDTIKKIALDATGSDWRARLRLILKEVSSVVPFDHATFGIYADDARLFRPLLMEPCGIVSLPTRWMELPAFVRGWLDGGKTWISDLRAFAQEHPTLLDNEVVEIYQARHLLSSVTLPVVGPAGPTSALSLCSAAVDTYGERDLLRLRDLDLESVLLRIEADIRAERDTLSQELKARLTSASSLRAAGQDLIDRLATYFEWDQMSLFRVNRHAQQFELVYQKARQSDFTLPEPYVQPIDQGMLAATLRARHVLIVDDTETPHQDRHGYKPVNPRFRSAMTAPLRLNGRTRWILNAESSVTHTFRGPDRDALVNVLRVLEEGLDQRFLTEMKSRLLHETQQGVFVVGLEGAILEMNEVGARLLGKRDPLAERGDATQIVQQYGADPLSQAVLAGLEPAAGQRIQLRGDDGKTRAVLATRRELDAAFDAALWFFTDLEAGEWNRELHFLRETVSDVAQQTRGPLAIAATLTLRAQAVLKRANARGGPLADLPATIERLCDRVGTEVGKADITFERLAERLSILKEPRRTREAVDLRECVDAVVAHLPERDRKRIALMLPGHPVAVSGDADRLAFVFRSILAYLVRYAAGDEIAKVDVAMAITDARADVALRLQGLPPAGGTPGEMEPRDAIWAAARAARDDSGLGSAALEKVVVAHDGTLSTESSGRRVGDVSPPWTDFRLTFPLLPKGPAAPGASP